jgi:sulfite exporter TauE/SafE/copper chaperone CopZ
MKPEIEKTLTLRIDGMTCVNCQNRIEKKLKSTVGVEDVVVSFSAGTAAVTYNPDVLTVGEITSVIEKLGYSVQDGEARIPAARIAGTLAIILALYLLLSSLGAGGLASAFPLAKAGMGYGMLFIIGLITSVHCIAMCGGINLSQCIPAAGPPRETERGKGKVLFPSVLYNSGRVISYTLTGIIVGALGSVITLSGRFQGVVQLAAGLFMVIMGINMLGIFPALRRFNPHIPRIFTRKIESPSGSKNPLIIGLLNGLMPCGPLQAMQLYALSTGSPVKGGIAMFLFSLGTVPLMFGIGALSSFLSNMPGGGRTFSRRVMQVGAILVTVLGMTMFSNGWNLSGINLSPPVLNAAVRNPASPVPVIKASFQIENGVQIVNSVLSGGQYPAITVQQGIPVKWTINAPSGSINGCNNQMFIREYGITHQFSTGENVIEFTPEKTGRFPYSCWMGMIRSSITVVAADEAAPAVLIEPDTSPFPAGVAIPTDRIALAEIAADGSSQTVRTSLRDEGIDPAIIVIQRRLPASWTINNDSLDPGNNSLIFPAYTAQFDMDQGDNTITLMPRGDFDYSTADNVFYGYVKVVEDLNKVDIEAIKAEVADFETLIYPAAYFDQASAGGCCR